MSEPPFSCPSITIRTYETKHQRANAGNRRFRVVGYCHGVHLPVSAISLDRMKKPRWTGGVIGFQFLELGGGGCNARGEIK